MFTYPRGHLMSVRVSMMIVQNKNSWYHRRSYHKHNTIEICTYGEKRSKTENDIRIQIMETINIEYNELWWTAVMKVWCQIGTKHCESVKSKFLESNMFVQIDTITVVVHCYLLYFAHLCNHNSRKTSIMSKVKQ